MARGAVVNRRAAARLSAAELLCLQKRSIGGYGFRGCSFDRLASEWIRRTVCVRRTRERLGRKQSALSPPRRLLTMKESICVGVGRLLESSAPLVAATRGMLALRRSTPMLSARISPRLFAFFERGLLHQDGPEYVDSITLVQVLSFSARADRAVGSCDPDQRSRRLAVLDRGLRRGFFPRVGMSFRSSVWVNSSVGRISDRVSSGADGLRSARRPRHSWNACAWKKWRVRSSLQWGPTGLPTLNRHFCPRRPASLCTLARASASVGHWIARQFVPRLHIFLILSKSCSSPAQRLLPRRILLDYPCQHRRLECWSSLCHCMGIVVLIGRCGFPGGDSAAHRCGCLGAGGTVDDHLIRSST